MFNELKCLEIYINQLEDAIKQQENLSPATYNYVRRTLELIVHKYCPTNLSVIQYIPYPTDSYTKWDRLANLQYTLDKTYDLVSSD
jgi:hypothetical protein